MNVNRKTLLMLILLLAGFAFVYIGFTVSLLGFLATIGAWLLVILVFYDYRRTQRTWERKHSQR